MLFLFLSIFKFNDILEYYVKSTFLNAFIKPLHKISRVIISNLQQLIL